MNTPWFTKVRVKTFHPLSFSISFHVCFRSVDGLHRSLYIIGLGLFDLGHAIYVRYKAESALAGSVGYAAHFGGALGGLLLGLVILKNIEVEVHAFTILFLVVGRWRNGIHNQKGMQ